MQVLQRFGDRYQENCEKTCPPPFLPITVLKQQFINLASSRLPVLDAFYVQNVIEQQSV